MKTATWILALTIVLALGTPAEARGIVIINTGDDILYLKDLQPDDARDTGFTKLGYHYERFGVFWLDMWRWGGEFCVYNGDSYAPLTAEDLEMLGGARLPFDYHVPPGLVIIGGIGLFALFGAMRKSRLAVAIGVAEVGVAALFFAKGLTWQVAIPAAVGTLNIVASWQALRDPDFDRSPLDQTT